MEHKEFTNSPAKRWGFEHERKELTGVTNFVFVDYLKYLLCHVDGSTELVVDGLYYYKVPKDYILPWDLDSYYLLLRFVGYYSDRSEYVAVFDADNVYRTKELAQRESVVHGFQKVMDFNDWYDHIPLVNETVHYDNAIISSMKADMTYEFSDPTGDNPLDFTITYTIDYDGDLTLVPANRKHWWDGVE